MNLNAGIENTTIDTTLIRLGKATGCFFTLETLNVSNRENPTAFMPVDFAAIKPDSDPIPFIKDRFPAYQIELIDGAKKLYRVFDLRLSRYTDYPVDRVVGPFKFIGTQANLPDAISQKVSGVSPFPVMTPSSTLYTNSGTRVDISLSAGSVRDILLAGSVRTADNPIIWRSSAIEVNTQMKVNVGYYGSPATE